MYGNNELNKNRIISYEGKICVFVSGMPSLDTFQFVTENFSHAARPRISYIILEVIVLHLDAFYETSLI